MKVELTDVVFAVDSILVAVAMSPKTWVVITGGILGIITMRLVIGKLLALVRRYPALVDGAFIIIAWVGMKLLLEFLDVEGWIHIEINKWFSFGMIVVIFLISYVVRAAAWAPPTEAVEDEATELLQQVVVAAQEPASLRSSVFAPPSSSVKRVAFLAARASHSGSLHSPCATYSTAIA